MNLLDLQVSITVDWKKAKDDIKEAKENIVEEANEIKEELLGSANEAKNAFASIADEDIFSTMLEGFKDPTFLTLFAAGMQAIEFGMAVTAAGAAEAAEKYAEYRDGLVMTAGPIEAMADNLETLKERYAALDAVRKASEGIGFDQKEFEAVDYAIEAQKIAMVEAAVQNLVTTYESAKAQVSGWFAPFQEAEQIQSASLDTMAANIQSQIDYNRQYQQSLETLTDAGYGELAVQMQELGKSGAGYLQAFAEAVSEGDTAAIESIQTLMEELSTSQEGLAGTITTTSGAFDTLIKTIETATEEPFQVVLEDNAGDVALAVQNAIGSIPDNTYKYINVITKYSSQTSGTADGYNAQGLDYVPFDGFISSLHKGERILTAAENREYTQGQTQAMPQEIRVVAPISVQIDGKTIAYETYDTYKQIESDRGNAYVRAKR